MVNAVNKLPFPITGARGKRVAKLLDRIQFYLYVLILVILAIGLWLTILFTNKWKGAICQSALHRYIVAENEEQENGQK